MLDAKIPDGQLEEKWSRYRSTAKLVSPANRKKFRIAVVGTGLAGSSLAASLGADCAFPLVTSMIPTTDLDEGFRGINWALLIGSVPRKQGMERKELLGIKGEIDIHGTGAVHREKCGVRRARARGRKSL